MKVTGKDYPIHYENKTCLKPPTSIHIYNGISVVTEDLKVSKLGCNAGTGDGG